MGQAASVDLDSLRAEHHALDRAIWEEEKRLAPDDTRIATLKKEKLHLKDRIAVLERTAR